MEKKNKSKAKQPLLVFRRWGRKNYSLFSTLKRVVKISVLSFAYFVVVPVAPRAQESDTTGVQMQFDLEEVQVSGREAPELYSRMVRVIHVIDSASIAQAPAASVQDLLEYLAAADIRTRGAEGVQADVGIRGGTFDQTLVLLNGINISDPQSGHHNLNLPVSLSQIERIEVLEGPAARIYGASAFSGALNIVTRQPAGQKATLDIGGGSYGYFNGHFSGSFQTGNVKHLVAGNRKRSDGYIENTDFKNSGLFYTNTYQSEKGKFSFQWGHSRKSFGANQFYTPKYPNQFEEIAVMFTSARWESALPMHFTPSVYWRRHSDVFMLFREDPPEWYNTHNYHRTDAWGASLHSWFRHGTGKTAFGAEFRSEGILSNVLGEPLARPVKIPGKSALFTHSSRRTITSLFVDHHYTLHAFSFTAGIMAAHLSGRGAGWNFFPGIDAGYSLTRQVKLVASFNTSMRIPTFTDLYYSGPVNVGNPELEPEKSMTLEGGVKVEKQFFSGHFIVFSRKGKNMIDWVKQSSDDLWRAQNHTGINSYGAEIRWRFSPAKKWGGKWPEKLGMGYYYNHQKKESPGMISHYVLDNLRHKLVVSLTQPLTKNISVDLRGILKDRDGTFSRFEKGTPVGEVPYQTYFLLDGKIFYAAQNLQVFVSGSNLLDREYFDLGNVIQPGRWVKAGISYRFNFQ